MSERYDSLSRTSRRAQAAGGHGRDDTSRVEREPFPGGVAFGVDAELGEALTDFLHDRGILLPEKPGGFDRADIGVRYVADEPVGAGGAAKSVAQPGAGGKVFVFVDQGAGGATGLRKDLPETVEPFVVGEAPRAGENDFLRREKIPGRHDGGEGVLHPNPQLGRVLDVPAFQG